MRGLIFALLCLPLAAQAHEFWIEPEAYQVAPGDQIVANLRVGEAFEGSAQSFLPRNFARFELDCAGVHAPVEGRAGDRPALSQEVAAAGLCVVIHQTRDYSLTYRKWDKFESFVRHKDFAQVLERHVARGLPKEMFGERYSRYAKSLISVGAGPGADADFGLATEIIAAANPYTDDLNGQFPVRVLYQGAPRGDAQVELFEKAPDGMVAISLHRTDAEGRVVLPVQAGHAYLVDAVVLRPVQPDVAGGPVWESLWASLTFAVPQEE